LYETLDVGTSPRISEENMVCFSTGGKPVANGKLVKVVWNHSEWIMTFPSNWGHVIIPTGPNSMIFQRARAQPPTRK
jgi:hypothetical protein